MVNPFWSSYEDDEDEDQYTELFCFGDEDNDEKDEAGLEFHHTSLDSLGMSERDFW